MVMLVDLNDMELSKIPMKYIYETLGKMGIYSCGLTEKVIVYNTKGIGWVWTIISKFLPDHSKQKIIFIQNEQYEEVFKFISPDQL